MNKLFDKFGSTPKIEVRNIITIYTAKCVLQTVYNGLAGCNDNVIHTVGSMLYLCTRIRRFRVLVKLASPYNRWLRMRASALRMVGLISTYYDNVFSAIL